MKPLVLASITAFILLLGACDPDDPAASGEEPGAGNGTAEGTDEAAVREVFAACRKAMADGDLDGLKKHMVKAKAEEMSKHDPDQLRELLKLMMNTNEEIEGVKIDRDRATIEATGKSDDQPATGKITFVREDGAWRLEKESWHIGDGPPPAEIKRVPRIPLPAGEWSLDLADRLIPARPAMGQLKGKPFYVDSCEIQQGIITFEQGDDFSNEGRIVVFLFGEVEKQPSVSLTVGPEDDGMSPHVHQHVPSENSMDMETAMDGYALKLQLDRVRNGKRQGRIYLCLPGEPHTYLAGTFEATVR